MQFTSVIFFLLLFTSYSFGQNTDASVLTFSSAQDLMDHAMDHSLDIKNNQIRLDQAKKDRLAALLSTIDVTGSLLSVQLTNNTNLGVNLFPAEVFGGDPGTFKEVEMGVQHNTNITSHLDIKLYNPNGYNNLKLADINIDIADINNQIHIREYQESLVASYYNIITIQKQIDNTAQSIVASDSLVTIVKNKYADGLARQQEVNDVEVNHLKLQESKRQLLYMLDQYYLSLKLLMDVDPNTVVNIEDASQGLGFVKAPSIMINELDIRSAKLQEQYALQNLKSAKQSLLPTVSLQLSNSWNLYNTEFTPFSGNWINSNYIGLRLNVPIPHSQQVSNRIMAEHELKIAANHLEKEKTHAQLEAETLQSEFDQATSQIKTNQRVLAIQKDTYTKNRNLYEEGVVNLEVVIQTLNTLLAAEYDVTYAVVNQALKMELIRMNNKTY